MLISFVNNSEFAYINLHAEQSFRDFQFLNLSNTNIDDGILINTEMGIYCRVLKFAVIQELLNNLESFTIKSEDNNFKCVILDFNYIKDIQSNMLGNLSLFFEKVIESKRDILIVNLDVYLLPQIQQSIKPFKSEINRDDRDEWILILKYEDRTVDWVNDFKQKQYTLAFTDKIFNDSLNNALIACSEDSDKPLYSTPVYTSKYINIKKCIEEFGFFPYAIYKLAYKLIDENVITVDPKENKKLELFCHTLNGSYIASLLSNLLCIDLVFFDHIGPINRLFKTFFNNRIDKYKSYIIVTDVICLGSELRAAKTLLDYSGAKYSGAVSIVNCRTISNSYENDKRYSLIELTKDYNPIEYYISTDLTKEKV